MTRVFVDSSLAEKLTHAAGVIELCDPTGRSLGWFNAVTDAGYDGPECPLPSAILDEIEREGGGRSLGEILRDFGNIA
jgi:hypothetical protein